MKSKELTIGYGLPISFFERKPYSVENHWYGSHIFYENMKLRSFLNHTIAEDIVAMLNGAYTMGMLAENTRAGTEGKRKEKGKK